MITPDQSVTPVLSTSAGFYNSLRTSKRKVGIFYLKTIKPNRLWEIQYTLYERLVWDRIYTQLVFEGMMIRTHSQYVVHKSVMSWNVLEMKRLWYLHFKKWIMVKINLLASKASQLLFEISMNKLLMLIKDIVRELEFVLFVKSFVCSDDFHLRECLLSKLLLITFKGPCIYRWGVSWWSREKIELLDTFLIAVQSLNWFLFSS